MSQPSKILLNPFILSGLGIVLLGGLAIGITKFVLSDVKEDVGSGKKNTTHIAKSSGHPSSSSGDNATGGPRKSKSKPGEEIQENGEFGSVPEKSKRQGLMTTISVQARNELKGLRELYRTEFDSAESRKKFSDTLRNTTDPKERERLLRERTTAQRIARNKAEAQKGLPERAREKRLIALMQVQNLWRMNSFVAQNESLSGEAGEFDDRLAEWVVNSEKMSDEEFHTTFNKLRNALNDLRVRNQGNTSRPKSPVPR